MRHGVPDRVNIDKLIFCQFGFPPFPGAVIALCLHGLQMHHDNDGKGIVRLFQFFPFFPVFQNLDNRKAEHGQTSPQLVKINRGIPIRIVICEHGKTHGSAFVKITDAEIVNKGMSFHGLS